MHQTVSSNRASNIKNNYELAPLDLLEISWQKITLIIILLNIPTEVNDAG